jgi:hypothetical protein
VFVIFLVQRLHTDALVYREAGGLRALVTR